MATAEQIAPLRARFQEVVGKLKQRFGESAFTTSEFRDNFRVHVPAQGVYAVLQFLKHEAGFDFLSERGGADCLRYPDAKDRYGVWYCLVNTATGQRLI